MASDDRSEEQDALVRGFYRIPHPGKLAAMSFAELASELSSCEKDSPKFHVVERELKKHLAKDQAEINRPNIVLGACIGLGGVILGAFLTYMVNHQVSKQIPPRSVVNQGPQIPPPTINSLPVHPSATSGAVIKPPAKADAQTGNTKP